AGRSARGFAGSFRRTLHRVGQDRIDSAAGGRRDDVEVLGVVRPDGVASRDRGDVPGVARTEPAEAGARHAIESVRRDRDRARGLKLMPSILIAGCGYVGEAAADAFHEQGWEVEGWTATVESAAKLSARP